MGRKVPERGIGQLAPYRRLHVSSYKKGGPKNVVIKIIIKSY